MLYKIYIIISLAYTEAFCLCGFFEKLEEIGNDLIANIEKTVEICHKHKKTIGMFMCNDNEAELWAKKGMNLFWVSTELGMLGAEIKRNKARIDEF